MTRPNSRQQIVDAAIRLMAEGGAEALTASALAGTVGVSKANLFHHFETMDDIVLAAFEQFVMGMVMTSGPPPATLRAWLVDMGAEATASIEDVPKLTGAYFAFVSRAQSDARLKARLTEIVVGAEAAFFDIIGGLRPAMSGAKIAALAALVVMAGDGLVLHRTFFPDRAETQAAAWRAFVDLVAPAEDS
ncbi:MAG: helix-turn-helix domain-containing protein [Devosia sp.]